MTPGLNEIWRRIQNTFRRIIVCQLEVYYSEILWILKITNFIKLFIIPFQHLLVKLQEIERRTDQLLTQNQAEKVSRDKKKKKITSNKLNLLSPFNINTVIFRPACALKWLCMVNNLCSFVLLHFATFIFHIYSSQMFFT